MSERQHLPVEAPPSTDEALGPLFALDVEDEDTGADSITEPFDPRKIRIETKPLTIDLLLKRIGEGEVDLAPDFQRAAGIWNIGAQSRLIESLLIRIPLPAFYMDATDDDKWLVVDGLQRLTVFNTFILKNAFPLAELEFLSQFNGKRHRELPRPMQRRIAETQVTVYLIQPGTPGEVKFNIFKRINTGGVPLSPQEIRHALNQGPAAELLMSLAVSPAFLRVAGRSLRDQRMTDRECVLRFMAFSLVPYLKYRSGNLDSFLNEQMHALNVMSDDHRSQLSDRFVRAMLAAHSIFGDDAFRKRYRTGEQRKPINKALFEAWSVALDRQSDANLATLSARAADVRSAFITLMNKDRDFETAISQGTGDVRKVHKRFSTIESLLKGCL